MDPKLRFKANLLLEQKGISILIISPQKYYQLLGSALKEKIEAKYGTSAGVSNAELIADVINTTNYSLFDSIVIAVDTTKEMFSSVVTATLMKISSKFLVSRTFLINASCRTCNFESAVEFKQIANKFKINYINCDIEDRESCCYLVERLTVLIQLVTGMSSGMQLLLPTSSVLSSIED